MRQISVTFTKIKIKIYSANMKGHISNSLSYLCKGISYKVFIINGYSDSFNFHVYLLFHSLF